MRRFLRLSGDKGGLAARSISFGSIAFKAMRGTPSALKR
jgi:hypothetical protein